MRANVCDICGQIIEVMDRREYAIEFNTDLYRTDINHRKLELCSACNYDLRRVITTKRIRERKIDVVKNMFNKLRGQEVNE